jgi:polyhydroxybutyrate depolymerase
MSKRAGYCFVIAAVAAAVAFAAAGLAQGSSGDAFSSQISDSLTWSGSKQPEVKEIVIDGVKRKYYLYCPASAKKPAPLVLSFHGGGGTAKRADCGMARLADQKGFVLVYPDGLEKHWNDGRQAVTKHNYDDVGFISKVIDDLVASKIADPKRVYATGISNGGFFSQYLAMQLPGKIAAVATVAASVPNSHMEIKSLPVPILLMLGTEDPLVPWKGGTVGGRLLRGDRGEVLSADDSLQFWLSRNKNSAQPVSSQLPDKDPTDGTRVSILQYGNDDSVNEVKFYKIQGGGHTWPGGRQYLPKIIIGPVCRDFDGNQAIWSFFEKHVSS